MTTTDNQPTTKPRRLGKRTVSTTTHATEPTATESPASTYMPQAATELPTAQDNAPASRRAQKTGHSYDELLRKEARLREDQVDSLNNHARRLARGAQRNRGPGDPTERITDNTLIRIGVDLLLARSGDLAGKTETELRKSVGLA